MPPKSKRTDGELPKLGAELPSLLEYTPLTGEGMWRVERFRELAAEFQFYTASNVEELRQQAALFHEVCHSRTRQWEFVRRLFGVNPLILPEGAVLDDYTVLTRQEICRLHGLADKDLQAELDVLRGFWLPLAGKFVPEEKPVIQKPAAKAALQGEFKDDAARILKEFGFDERIFEDVAVFDIKQDPKENPTQMVKRPRDKNLQERDWFAARVEECRAMLLEPAARTLVRDMLMNELFLSRCQDEQVLLMPSTKEFERIDKRKADLEGRLQTQTERLEKMFPQQTTGKRVNLRQCFSDAIAGEQEFYGDQNNVRRTALFTAAELQILFRQSLQNPNPQYRFSLELLVVEAIHGLYDRKFRSALATRTGYLKRIDAVVRAAINGTRESLQEPLVDLEKGVTPDEGDNFEALVYFDKPKTA